PVLGFGLHMTGVPAIKPGFFPVLLAGGVANTAATILYMRAMKRTDISICVPLTALTPAFMLLTSPIMLSEFPGAGGITGILLITAGSYFLHMEPGQNRLIAPFKALFHDHGARCMAAVALIWSVSANFDKMGVLHSSPLFWALCSSAMVTVLIFLTIIALGRGGQKRPRNLGNLMPAGLCHGLMLYCQMTAISMTLAAYVIAVKRMSILLVVVAGCFIFREKNFRNKILGALLLIAGAVMITLET
ncbi:MAG: EamA family transporter, partial [Candidatus Wallbacteria bacterium]|nr:EamA family transporter [Candidatus Wallbacteria bacterium]